MLTHLLYITYDLQSKQSGFPISSLSASTDENWMQVAWRDVDTENSWRKQKNKKMFQKISLIRFIALFGPAWLKKKKKLDYSIHSGH